jgi:CBS-domain-containing membrane protein
MPDDTESPWRPNWRFAILAGLGAALAIGAMEGFSLAMHYPLAVIPFATSIVVVISMPSAAPSRPRALVGGHLIATLVGLVVVKVTGASGWAAALAVGLATFAMIMTDTLHPPAGIDPLVVVLNDLSWSFLFAPVLAGAFLLLAFAWFWHRAVLREDWPRKWM